MPRARCLSLLAAVLLLFAVSAPLPAATVVDPPVTVAVTVIEEPRNRRIVGELVEYDDLGPTLLVDGERQRFTWREMTPTSGFTIRHRATDQNDARQWLDLGRFGWRLGVERQAELALRKAVELDEALAEEAEAVRELTLGELREATRIIPKAAEPTESEVAPQPDPVRPHQSPKFLPVAAIEAAAAEEEARQTANQQLMQLNVRMREVTTPHFMIFTDWEPVDDPWLAEQLEGAYRMLCREFNVPPDQPVFVGRLPVFMFHSHATMIRFAREADRFDEVRPTVAGYYWGRSDGRGKLVMSKPQATEQAGLPLARQMWARTLTHEFVHAFLARYHGNGQLPRWLNEGLAEMLAETIYPRPAALETARNIALSGESIAEIFDDANMPGARWYPVMMTLTAALYREDPARFVTMVDRIKFGEPPEAVLQELYGVDYAGLESAWRTYMRRN